MGFRQEHSGQAVSSEIGAPWASTARTKDASPLQITTCPAMSCIKTLRADICPLDNSAATSKQKPHNTLNRIFER
jgi:hypothetical protein